MNEEIDIILSRYFSGEATEKELHTLDIWLSSSDENEKMFHQMTLLYQHAGQTDVSTAIDTEKAWTQFQTYMSEKQKNNYNIFKPSNIWKVAAAVAILAIASFTTYYFLQPSKTIQLIAEEAQQEYEIFENANITLFPGAEIIYDKKAEHQIHLKGKATFNIQSTKKLVVQAGETYIQDIGTVFNIDATAPDKSITVEVFEGEVWFYTDENNGVHLKADERAVYDSQTKQFNMIAPIELIDNELIFNNMPLHEVIDIIKSRYHVNVVINSKSLNEILLNASFDKNESVEYVLEVITATLSAQLSKKNDSYIIGI